jgi:hypothetical protein
MGEVIVGASIGEAVVVGILIDVVVLRSAVEDSAVSILAGEREVMSEGVTYLCQQRV